MSLSIVTVQRLLDVEVALALALADAGAIPVESVEPIRDAARADRFALDDLQAQAERAGNLVIPLVKQLTARVAESSPAAAGHVHFGATSQDILDTAMVLAIRDAAAPLHHELSRVMTRAATLARDHASTPMAGRTWLQQASPVSFGLKAAGWLDLVGRCRERLAEATRRAMVVQLGGASGTLATLGACGPAVIEAFAKRLSLVVPEMPWHTQRDRFVNVACALGLGCGALGKIGRDLTLLAQTEVGEVTPTRESGGSSSSMPHKQNPVGAVRLIAASTRAPGLVATMLSAMPQEHERAAGGWQSEWDTLPVLLELTLDAARTAADALERMRIEPDRMAINFAAQGGIALSESLVAALAVRAGRPAAMILVDRLCRETLEDARSLLEVATTDTELEKLLTREEIVAALTPSRALGSATLFIERVLARWPE